MLQQRCETLTQDRRAEDGQLQAFLGVEPLEEGHARVARRRR